MPGFSLRTSMAFEWNGAECRIERIQPNDEVLIERLEDGRFEITTRGALLADFTNGFVRVVRPEHVDDVRVPVYGRPLEDLDERVRAEVDRRRQYLELVLKAGKPKFTVEYLEPKLEAAAKALKDTKPPSIPTFYRWYARHRHHNDLRCLVPRWDRRGSTNPKQASRILELLEDCIEEAYKASPSASTASIHSRLCLKVDKENESLLNGQPLVPPSVRTVYRLIEKIDAIDIHRAKHGAAVADKRFRLAGGIGVRTARILERVEIDHTPLDLFVVDEATGLPLGRPWLTVVLDHHSRMILGYYLSFGPPSAEAVVGALRHAILPKPKLIEAIPGLSFEHEWICYGKPEVFVLDNGLEFLGRVLESIAFDLGIRLQFCPKRQPRFKGSVERFLKTINHHFAALLPGASMAKLHLRGDYDPQKMAVLTFAECKHVVEKWILDVYAQRKHKTLRVSPWYQWQQGLRVFEPELPDSLESLRRRIGIVSERKVQKDGLTENGIRYSSGELQEVANTYGIGVSLRLLFDPEDLGEIHVWKPDEDEPFTVLAVDPAARGRTLYQQQLILQEMNANGESKSDEKCAQRALGAILQATTDLLASRKQRDRSKAARLIGVTSSKAQQEGNEYLRRQEAVVATPLRALRGTDVMGELPVALEAFEIKQVWRGRGE